MKMKELGLFTVEKRRETAGGREEKELRTIDEEGNRCYNCQCWGTRRLLVASTV